MDIRIQTLIEVIIGAILFFIVWGRRYIPKKSSGTVWRGVDSHESIDSCIERLSKTFMKPYDEFIVPEDIISILEREPYSEYALNLFLQKVAAHLGYSRQSLVLRTFPEKKGTAPGRISKLGSTFLMELHMSRQANVYNILAVIVHEFCHFFLDSNGIKLVNTLENEILTDVASVYFGFFSIMREGYRPTFRMKDGKNEWCRIGYVDVRGLEYAWFRKNQDKNNPK